MKGNLFRRLRIQAGAFFCGIAAAAAAAAGAATFSKAAQYIYPGDLNTDLNVDVLDAVMLARTVGDDPELHLSDEAKRNGDIDFNGVVEANDLSHLMRQLAGYEPLSEPIKIQPETTKPPATTTTSSASETTTATTSTTTVTSAAATSAITTTSTEITTTTTASTQPYTAPELVIDGKTLPLEVSLSVLTGGNAPDELLTVQYQSCNITYAVYAGDAAHTLIGIAADDKIIGYYAFGLQYTAPEGYDVVEYVDTHSAGSGKLYAILAVKNGYSIRFNNVNDRTNLTVMGKLNYYGVNGIRAINGLTPYKWDEELAKVALGHSREMAEMDYFDHKSSDGSKFSARLTAAGIDWQKCAENIDCGYTDPFGALNGWYNSESGHRNNILSDTYTNIGIGFAYGANSYYGYYGTQDFYKGWD